MHNVWLNLFLLRESGLASFIGISHMNHLGEAGGPFPEVVEAFRQVVMATDDMVFHPAPGRTSEWYDWQVPELEATRRGRNIAGGWHWVRPGAGSGPLLGAEAWLFTQVLERFALPLDGCVLFWDVSPMTPLTAHGALAQLAAAADLTRLSGMMVGVSPFHATERDAVETAELLLVAQQGEDRVYPGLERRVRIEVDRVVDAGHVVVGLWANNGCILRCTVFRISIRQRKGGR